ncbi:MAG: bifunctional phosphoribosyl-AMP cyclohydrolase/phosphoribosyl-ATP diphosphatase HisIE [Eubacteriales bacterium]|jgi:phosphoribosyl-ATP pyrophosphohydrolase/phosphoribosyl-AMP cyclohydrolase
MDFDFQSLRYNHHGLLPAIVQDAFTLQVLMMGYMNAEALEKTMTTGTVWFYSRSRKTLWNKGETSGNYLKTVEVKADCDADCLLVKAIALGPTCHTNATSCFFNDLYVNEELSAAGYDILTSLYRRIADRKNNPKEGAYTTYLFEKGLDKILKKVGEESAEVIIAAKNTAPDEIVYETADLIYHLLVMLAEQDVDPRLILAELHKRYHS